MDPHDPSTLNARLLQRYSQSVIQSRQDELAAGQGDKHAMSSLGLCGLPAQPPAEHHTTGMAGGAHPPAQLGPAMAAVPHTVPAATAASAGLIGLSAPPLPSFAMPAVEMNRPQPGNLMQTRSLSSPGSEGMAAWQIPHAARRWLPMASGAAPRISAPPLQFYRWTREEDRVLLEHVKNYGTRQWTRLRQSGRLPNRDNKACCNRFLLLKKRHLDEADGASAGGGSNTSSSFSGAGTTSSLSEARGSHGATSTSSAPADLERLTIPDGKKGRQAKLQDDSRLASSMLALHDVADFSRRPTYAYGQAGGSPRSLGQGPGISSPPELADHVAAPFGPSSGCAGTPRVGSSAVPAPLDTGLVTNKAAFLPASSVESVQFGGPFCLPPGQVAGPHTLLSEWRGPPPGAVPHLPMQQLASFSGQSTFPLGGVPPSDGSRRMTSVPAQHDVAAQDEPLDDSLWNQLPYLPVPEGYIASTGGGGGPPLGTASGLHHQGGDGRPFSAQVGQGGQGHAWAVEAAHEGGRKRKDPGADGMPGGMAMMDPLGRTWPGPVYRSQMDSAAAGRTPLHGAPWHRLGIPDESHGLESEMRGSRAQAPLPPLSSFGAEARMPGGQGRGKGGIQGGGGAGGGALQGMHGASGLLGSSQGRAGLEGAGAPVHAQRLTGYAALIQQQNPQQGFTDLGIVDHDLLLTASSSSLPQFPLFGGALPANPGGQGLLKGEALHLDTAHLVGDSSDSLFGLHAVEAGQSAAHYPKMQCPSQEDAAQLDVLQPYQQRFPPKTLGPETTILQGHEPQDSKGAVYGGREQARNPGNMTIADAQQS